MSVPLRALPREERPRERLLQYGAERLTNAELVAILLRTGVRNQSAVEVARELLRHCEEKSPGQPLNHLLGLRPQDIRKVVKGVGEAKLAQLLAGLQLGQRAQYPKPRRHDLSNPRAVYEYLSSRMAHLTKEQFQVILLNAKNNILDVECIVSEGTLTASLVHPREIFKSAIQHSAHAIILAHNHPSGDATPSREDREVTERLVQAGKVIGIEVLDHLIIGRGDYTSFREKGLVQF